MSFQPPSFPDPTGGPQGPSGPPRSTPIPGSGSPMPGGPGAGGPPTPSEFVNAPGGQMPPQMPMGGYSPVPGAPFAMPPKRGRGVGGWLFILILLAGPILGIVIGLWAWNKSNDTINDANATIDSALSGLTIPEITIPDITIPEITIPSITMPTETTVGGVVDPATTVAPVDPATTVPPTAPPAVNSFAEGGAPQVIAAYEAAISGDPSRFLQIILYPDYAFAQAQDANIPDHVDEYPWRDGVVGASSPVTLVGDGDLESNLFSATEIDWTFIARAVAEAPALAAVEEGVVSHIIVERSVFTPDFAVVVHVYVSGPRGGGYVEYTPAGVMTKVVV